MHSLKKAGYFGELLVWEDSSSPDLKGATTSRTSMCLHVIHMKHPGLDPNFICHRLNSDPLCPSKKQKPRGSSDVHAGAVKEEVDRLKEAGVIKEVFYLKWLANTIMVKKKNGKWRVCVDFTNLNKACLKDHFPMPKID